MAILREFLSGRSRFVAVAVVLLHCVHLSTQAGKPHMTAIINLSRVHRCAVDLG